MRKEVLARAHVLRTGGHLEPLSLTHLTPPPWGGHTAPPEARTLCPQCKGQSVPFSLPFPARSGKPSSALTSQNTRLLGTLGPGDIHSQTPGRTFNWPSLDLGPVGTRGAGREAFRNQSPGPGCLKCFRRFLVLFLGFRVRYHWKKDLKIILFLL